MPGQCPRCNSKSLKRNGFTRHGKQNHRCLDCGKQFSTEPNVSIVIVPEENKAAEEVCNTAPEMPVCPYTAMMKDAP